MPMALGSRKRGCTKNPGLIADFPCHHDITYYKLEKRHSVLFQLFPSGAASTKTQNSPPPLEVQEEVGRGLFAARSHGFEGLRGSAVWGIYKPEK